MTIRSLRTPRSLRHPIAWALLLCATVASAAPGGRMRKVYDPKAGAIGSGAMMQGGGQPHLSQAQYDQLKYVGTELMRRFPPSKNYYFGLGRSPGAIISMIQNLAGEHTTPEELAMNFPASGMHDGGHHDDASYFRHFDALIPKAVLKGDRAIVLLDRSRPYSGPHSGGESLYIFKLILERYLAARGSSVKVEAVGFSYGQLNPSYGLHHIPFDMNSRPELERVSMPHYEAIAEYPHHRIGPSMQVPGRRAEYDKYRGHMLERMKRDPELDAFLDKTVASELKVETAAEKAERLAIAKRADDERAAAEQAAARAKEALERGEKAKLLVSARAFPKTMVKTIDELVASLPPRADGHDQGPYLSESAQLMNGWLKQALSARDEVERLVPAVQKAGPNLVAAVFMDRVEQARAEGKLRNRDYRRLMGHAISASVMDAPMLASLARRFEKSKHFRREVTEEADYFLGAPSKKAEGAADSLAAHFQVMLRQLPQSAQAAALAASASKAE